MELTGIDKGWVVTKVCPICKERLLEVDYTYMVLGGKHDLVCSGCKSEFRIAATLFTTNVYLTKVENLDMLNLLADKYDQEDY